MWTPHVVLVLCVCFVWPTVWAAPVYDVVVYGSTPGGVMAAVAAGKALAPGSVVLLSPTVRLGGMTAGGLGHTDSGNSSVIGGLALEFFKRTSAVYRGQLSFDVTPGVALRVFQDMLAGAGVRVMADPAFTVAGVAKSGTEVQTVVTANGTAVSGRVFVDASYEGDLFAAAGASFTVGREAASMYNETSNGRMLIPNNYGGDNHQFHRAVMYGTSGGETVPQIFLGPVAPVGGADVKVQAYNFRMCFTKNVTNMVPIPAPRNFSAPKWALAHNWFAALNGSATSLTDFMIVSELPDGKTDINNHGPISTDFIGGSWAWPTANSSTRAAIFDAHVQYTLEFLHFLATDPLVPASVSSELASYGLCKDEFTESGGFPPQLYVREGRRLVGDFVFTQRDRTTQRSKPDSVGLGSYNIDNHHAERILQPWSDGTTRVVNEGNTEAFSSDGVFDLPYRLLLPRAAEVTNMLVPVAVSASHSGFGSIRLEPQWMILGQAAGTAAVLAIADSHSHVHSVDVAALQAQLVKDGQII